MQYFISGPRIFWVFFKIYIFLINYLFYISATISPSSSPPSPLLRVFLIANHSPIHRPPEHQSPRECLSSFEVALWSQSYWPVPGSCTKLRAFWVQALCVAEAVRVQNKSARSHISALSPSHDRPQLSFLAQPVQSAFGTLAASLCACSLNRGFFVCFCFVLHLLCVFGRGCICHGTQVRVWVQTA